MLDNKACLDNSFETIVTWPRILEERKPTEGVRPAPVGVPLSQERRSARARDEMSARAEERVF